MNAEQAIAHAKLELERVIREALTRQQIGRVGVEVLVRPVKGQIQIQDLYCTTSLRAG